MMSMVLFRTQSQNWCETTARTWLAEAQKKMHEETLTFAMIYQSGFSRVENCVADFSFFQDLHNDLIICQHVKVGQNESNKLKSNVQLCIAKY